MSDYSTFTRSTGSAIVLRSSLAYIGGEVVFDSNFAFTGGALNILDGSRVGGGVMLTVCVCVCGVMLMGAGEMEGVCISEDGT